MCPAQANKTTNQPPPIALVSPQPVLVVEKLRKSHSAKYPKRPL
jgi:hypothetical protein